MDEPVAHDAEVVTAVTGHAPPLVLDELLVCLKPVEDPYTGKTLATNSARLLVTDIDYGEVELPDKVAALRTAAYGCGA